MEALTATELTANSTPAISKKGYDSDHSRIIRRHRVVLPSGKTQIFDETPDGRFYCAGGTEYYDSAAWAEGRAKMVAAGCPIETVDVDNG